MNHHKYWKIGKRCSCLSPPERISPLLTDPLRQIKGTLFDISDWTPQIPLTVVFSSENNLREYNQDVINSKFFIKLIIKRS